METNKVTLNFRHPTDSEQVMTAAVSAEATPKFLVDQLVKAGFMPALGATGRYVLRNGKTGMQLLENGNLAAAGVTEGTDIVIDATMSGAATYDGLRRQ